MSGGCSDSRAMILLSNNRGPSFTFEVEWHKICLLAYVEILIPPHNNLILILTN
ncbi:hypothetical protein FNV43_RR19410 [Rhamnella rubrinervis]|uniref:Uncharacterized protein n=1 Tax=Rhamnella rubrinervis TaxID=2594499 RepID=A0A8K0GTN7_9ROSA|nr:hypothetical protein FNV43_RR19410 [Rhamnella rubrinervis]